MNSMDQAKQFAVNWSNHMNHIKQAFDNLLNNNDFTDVTLYVEGNKIGAHKMLLSACSNYFHNLFREFPQEHPIVVLKGVRCCVLRDILKFIYSGEVSVDSKHFDNFIQTAEFLQISGLTATKNDHNECMAEFTNSLPQNKHSRRVRSRKRKESPNIKEEKPNSEDEDFDAKVTSTIFANDICDIQMGSDMEEDFPDYGADEVVVKKEEISDDDPSINLQVHQPTNNYPIDNLTCPICFKVFTHPYSLHHHKPVHLGRTKCPICSAVLSRKYNLKMHMKSKHNIV